jgi:hypothetical protein
MKKQTEEIYHPTKLGNVDFTIFSNTKVNKVGVALQRMLCRRSQPSFSQRERLWLRVEGFFVEYNQQRLLFTRKYSSEESEIHLKSFKT